MRFIQSIKRDHYEILQLNRGKANPINHDVVSQIREEVARIEADDNCRGIIWTGSTPGFFSVGLDLKEIYYYDEPTFLAFKRNWDAMVMDLTKCSKPMIAAINGYSPAGGCVLAITCDYRMMAEGEKFLIGLNEVAVGITVPETIYELFAFWVGSRLAYQYLMRGKLLRVDQAKAANLIDEVHPMEALLPAAEKEMQRLLRAPDQILRKSKMAMRSELIRRMENAPEIDDQTVLDAWFHPEARALTKAVVENLSK